MRRHRRQDRLLLGEVSDGWGCHPFVGLVVDSHLLLFFDALLLILSDAIHAQNLFTVMIRLHQLNTKIEWSMRDYKCV